MRVSAPETPVRKRSDVKRENIIRTAAQLFLERGYDNVSINDIIEVIGGSKGTIYSNFGNKEKLFEAVVEQICAEVVVSIDIDSNSSVEDQFRRMARSFLEKVLSPTVLQFHRLITSMGHTFPKAGKLFYETGPHATYTTLSKWIAHHQKEGNLRDDVDPFRLAVLLHNMLLTDQQIRWLTSAGTDDDRAQRIEQTIDMAVKVFLSGCLPQK